jgi:ABC-2 type transport system permease protein
MVSAWARSKPLLWAVGAPLLVGGLLSWANALFGLQLNMKWFWQHIIGRGLTSVVPGSWLRGGEPEASMHGGVDLMHVVRESWALVGGVNLWIGVLAGIAMLIVAVRLRRWRDEG